MGVLHYFNKENPENSVVIDKIESQKLMLGVLADAGCPGLAVFGADEMILDIGKLIYDFTRDDYLKQSMGILKFLGWIC